MKRIPRLLLVSMAALFLAAVPLSQAQTFKILVRFPNQQGGGNPSALLDVNGNLFGTTAVGGPSKLGNVFELTSQRQESTLYSFTNTTPDGRIPTIGPLVRDAQGNFYGTTQDGGDYNCIVFFARGCGTVFKLNPSGQETILHSFTGGTDGAQPLAGLVADSAGNLYGTTYVGGTGCNGGGCGTVYKVSPNGTEIVLYRFSGGADGSTPYAVSLAIDAKGNLYGTTLGGGDLSCGTAHGGCGTVFKVDPTGNETVLHAFTGSIDGGYPYAGVVLDSRGNLYGTTASGGEDGCCGTVFKVDSSGHQTMLYSFSHADTGYGPVSGLVLDSAGNLYGTTLYGGDFSQGSVFKVDSHVGYSLLHSFGADFTGGIWPMAGLTRDSAGNFFGTTSAGGKGSCTSYNGCGVVFEITP